MNTNLLSRLPVYTALCSSFVLCVCGILHLVTGGGEAPGSLPEQDLALAAELELLLLEPDSGGGVFTSLPERLSEPVYLGGEPLNAPGGASTQRESMIDLDTALQTTSVAGLSIPSTFAITRPTQKLSTSYSSYFITGTSDPDRPVYFQDQEIERLGRSGVFGVLVDLSMGPNTFEFRQGERTETVTITRTVADSIGPINEIRQSSMVPAVMTGVRAGEKLSVGCIAPAGATVTARYGGRTVALVQTKDDVGAGLPATFTGRISIDEEACDPGVTERGSEVAYSMTWRGQTSDYLSSGPVYVAGVDSRIAVQVTGYVGFVYPDTHDLSVFKEVVKAGARDYVVEETNEYFELSSGGFLNKRHAQIITGKVRVVNRLDDVRFSRLPDGERFVFCGTRTPLYDTWITDNVFYLRLYNTAGTPQAFTGNSRLTTSVTAEEDEEKAAVTYRFPLKGLLWGYDVSFDGDDTLLTWKYKPAVNGMTILLDPGHGGSDPGALGLAGTTGPTEADVNLANALAVRDELEALGAKVILTRTGDEYVSLDERLERIEAENADLFLSIHHNSMAESGDANRVSGVEVYYHTTLSRKTGNHLMKRLTTDLDRTDRSVMQSYYRVTLLPYAPSMLLELGFMSHPLDYENAVDPAEMRRVAKAIADGVQQALA